MHGRTPLAAGTAGASARAADRARAVARGSADKSLAWAVAAARVVKERATQRHSPAGTAAARGEVMVAVAGARWVAAGWPVVALVREREAAVAAAVAMARGGRAPDGSAAATAASTPCSTEALCSRCSRSQRSRECRRPLHRRRRICRRYCSQGNCPSIGSRAGQRAAPAEMAAVVEEGLAKAREAAEAWAAEARAVGAAMGRAARARAEPAEVGRAGGMAVRAVAARKAPSLRQRGGFSRPGWRPCPCRRQRRWCQCNRSRDGRRTARPYSPAHPSAASGQTACRRGQRLSRKRLCR